MAEAFRIRKQFYSFTAGGGSEACSCPHRPGCLITTAVSEAPVSRSREMTSLFSEMLCRCPHSIFCASVSRTIDYHAPKFDTSTIVDKEDYRMISEWAIAARIAFLSALEDQADILVLNHSSKRPVSSKTKRVFSRYPVPVWFNYGIRPKKRSRLYIFDIDVPKDIPISERREYAERTLTDLSEVIGFDLRKSLAVRTPSEGIHCYMMLPEGTDTTDLPKATLTGHKGLRKLYPDYAYMRVDIRSGGTDMYAVGVGSLLQQDEEEIDLYTFAASEDMRHEGQSLDKTLTIPELPQASVERLRDLTRNNDKLIDPFSGGEEDFVPLNRELVPQKERDILFRRMSELGEKKFHQKRAVVIARLACCYTEAAVADVIVDMKLDRDTHRGRELTSAELMKDIRAFWDKAVLRCFHRKAADKAIAEKVVARETFLKEKAAAYAENKGVDMEAALVAARIATKRERTTGSTFYRVRSVALDTQKVITALDAGRKMSQRRIHAFRLLFSYFYPLSAIGVSQIIVSLPNLAEDMGMKKHEVSDAMRVLRDARILKLTEKQAQGRASKYQISPSFIDPVVTTLLRKTWAFSRKEKSGGFAVYIPSVVNIMSASIDRVDGTNAYPHPAISESREVLVKYLTEKNVPLSEIYLRSRLVEKFSQPMIDNYALDENTGEISSDVEETIEENSTKDPEESRTEDDTRKFHRIEQ